MIDDVKIALQFLTRLPIKIEASAGMADLARAGWAFPLVGLVVGGLGWVVYLLAHAAGLPLAMTAILAVAAMIMTTGALHEDGLADTFDALGGHAGRELALAIMRDSRIGTYGALALMAALALRVGAVAAITRPGGVAVALIASASLSRATMVLLMARQYPARSEGLGSAAGTVARSRAAAACVLGVLAVLPAGNLPLIASVLALAASAFIVMERWTTRRLGGFTGDTVGATQQVVEAACLCGFAAFWS